MKEGVLKLFLILITGIPIAECATIVTDEFQYKHVIIGVVLAPDTLPFEHMAKVKYPLLELISRSVDKQQMQQMPSMNENGTTGDYTATNITRTANITILQLELDSDLEKITDISVILSLAGCAETHDLNSRITKMFGPVVHIAFTEPGCVRLDRSSSVMVPLTWYRTNADLLQLFTDVRSDNVLPKWKEAVVIYDSQSREGMIDTFIQAFSSHSALPEITLSLFTVDSLSKSKSFSEQIEEVLAMYRGSVPTKFIVVSEFSGLNFILVTAKRRHMLNVMKQWLFVSSDTTEDPDKWTYVTASILTDGVNVAFITNSSRNFTDRPDHLFCHMEAIATLLAETIEELASWEFNLFLQVSDEEWDVIKPSRADRVMNITEDMTERLGSFVLSLCDKNSSTWNLEAGEYGTKGKQIFEVGWWNPVTGLRMTDDLFPHVTGGFRGRSILVTSMHFPPWQWIKHPDPSDETNVTFSGLMFEVLEHMGKNLNFSYSVLEPPPGEAWGTIQPDGRWNGMMRLIIENPYIVLGAAAFTVTPERAGFINFTEVIEREAYAFMVNRPAELSRVSLFADPFSIEVWLCIIATVIIIAPIYHWIHCESYYYKRFNKVNERGLFQLKNCYWYVYGALLQQGGTHLPEAVSGRLLIGIWWLFVIVFVTSYSGNLVAFMTFPKIENPVSSIDDVLQYRGVASWGFMSGSVIEDHLKRSNDPRMKELYDKAKIHPAFNDSVLQEVKNHDHAYIDWKITLMTAMRDAFKISGNCDFILGEETIFEEKIALAVPRDSPYLPLFNQEIKEMLQTGLIKKWKSRYWPSKDRCSMARVFGADRTRTVKIGDMQGSFYMLIVGFTVSFLILGGEIFLHRRKKKRMVNSLSDGDALAEVPIPAPVVITNKPLKSSKKNKEGKEEKKKPFWKRKLSKNIPFVN